MPATLPVLVVGAGPVGLVAACELGRYGIPCRIVDRKPGPVTHSHALVVHVRTQEVLNAMGIVDGWLQHGYPFTQLSLRAFGERVGTLTLAGIDSPHPVPLDIWQSQTEELLLARLAALGIPVERPVEAIDFAQNETGVQVTLKHPEGREESVTASWLVDCEGGASMVRGKLNIPFEGSRYAGQEFVQTDARVRWSYPTGVGYAFVTKDRFLGMFPFSADGCYRVLCARRDPDPSNHNPPTLDEMQQIVREIADPEAELSEPQWFNRFRTQHRIAQRFREGRSFLAGDAGHVHVPVAGQGMNTGMQDAFNLIWKLAYVIKGWAPYHLLDSYNAERHPVAEALIRFTDTSFHNIAHPGAAMEFALRHFGAALLHRSAVQERLRAKVEEVDIAYPDSPLSENHIQVAPRAGDRAPHAVIVTGSDRRTASVFDVLRGLKWTALLFTGESPAPDDYQALAALERRIHREFAHCVQIKWVFGEPVAQHPPPTSSESVVYDRELTLHSRYGFAKPGICLIRPDWYIGFRGHHDRASEALTYLSRVLHHFGPNTDSQ